MKIETHAHTAEVSPCANVDAKTMITAYSKCGYDAVVITDHFKYEVVGLFGGSDREKVERYLLGYRIAKELEQELKINVLLGTEVCLNEGLEDFLIFGIDEDFLFDNPRIYECTQRELFRETEAAGALLYQAHPCRGYCEPKDPFLLHGTEVYNGNPRHDNHNDRAFAWASSYPHLLMSSGSDYHQTPDLGRGGVIIQDPAKINTSVDLCEYFKNNKPKLITDKKGENENV